MTVFQKLKNWKLEKLFLEIKNRPILKKPRKSLSTYQCATVSSHGGLGVKLLIHKLHDSTPVDRSPLLDDYMVIFKCCAQIL